MTEVISPQIKRREEWLANNQIYCDSHEFAWGLMPETLETVCLGTTDHVKQVLETKSIPKNQCQGARIALQYILDYIEEEKNAEPKPREVRRHHSERSRLSSASRHRR